MFGYNVQGLNEYSRIGLETGVVSANPHRLIVMLFDGAILACKNALPQIEAKAYAEKGAMISKAIMIIESGLKASLDKKAGGEIAESLDALYDYMSNRLYIANLKNQPEPVHEVIRLLSELRSAWEGIQH
jgi:flagellar secretion chaperone FliS